MASPSGTFTGSSPSRWTPTHSPVLLAPSPVLSQASGSLQGPAFPCDAFSISSLCLVHKWAGMGHSLHGHNAQRRSWHKVVLQISCSCDLSRVFQLGPYLVTNHHKCRGMKQVYHAPGHCRQQIGVTVPVEWFVSFPTRSAIFWEAKFR